jgi:cytochrome d ubiquinol oxidase subunit II
MVEIWFALLCFTIIVFVVLDGWDIGAGALHLIVAKSQTERREVVAAIGPLWSWHEVWLVAAGGTFILAFPAIMAAAFSGFYLALWLVLWSFVLRGISIEVGGHFPDRMWQTFWDFVFAVSNLLLAVLFGAALGNVIRGVPVDESGRFSMALFTDFTARGDVGILDWYTLSVAVLATLLLVAHGATYLRLKTVGPVHERSQRLARLFWLSTAVLFPLVSIATWVVRPELYQSMAVRPIAWFFVAVMLAGIWSLWTGLRRPAEMRAFIGSCAVIVGSLGAAAAGVFPEFLHSTLSPEHSLTAYGGAVSGRGLGIALVWWPVAAGLAVLYFVTVARQYAGKVRVSDDTQGFS